MKKKSKDLPLWKVLELTVDEYTGVAGMALSATPQGYRFYDMVRKGTKAKIRYICVDADKESK